MCKFGWCKNAMQVQNFKLAVLAVTSLNNDMPMRSHIVSILCDILLSEIDIS